MPRYKLSDVPLHSLQAELERRAEKLAALLKLRDDVDRQIRQLDASSAGVGKAPTAKKPVARKKAAKKAPVKKAPVVDKGGKRRNRGKFGQTGEEFVVDLLKGGKMKTSELISAWAKAGRGGKVDNALTQLVKTGQVKREKIKDGKGSEYTLA